MVHAYSRHGHVKKAFDIVERHFPTGHVPPLRRHLESLDATQLQDVRDAATESLKQVPKGNTAALVVHNIAGDVAHGHSSTLDHLAAVRRARTEAKAQAETTRGKSTTAGTSVVTGTTGQTTSGSGTKAIRSPEQPKLPGTESTGPSGVDRFEKGKQYRATSEVRLGVTHSAGVGGGAVEHRTSTHVAKPGAVLEYHGSSEYGNPRFKLPGGKIGEVKSPMFSEIHPAEHARQSFTPHEGMKVGKDVADEVLRNLSDAKAKNAAEPSSVAIPDGRITKAVVRKLVADHGIDAVLKALNAKGLRWKRHELESRVQMSDAERAEQEFEQRLDLAVEHIMLSAKTTGAYARHKLRPLLKYYAKKKHPFRACVHDNMKRFGPGRTEGICATLKDIIRGTTHWRGHPALDHGAPGLATALADDEIPPIDDELAELLESVDAETLEEAAAMLDPEEEVA